MIDRRAAAGNICRDRTLKCTATCTGQRLQRLGNHSLEEIDFKARERHLILQLIGRYSAPTKIVIATAKRGSYQEEPRKCRSRGTQESSGFTGSERSLRLSRPLQPLLPMLHRRRFLRRRLERRFSWPPQRNAGQHSTIRSRSLIPAESF